MRTAFEFYDPLPIRPEMRERLFFMLLPDAPTSGRVMDVAEWFIREHRLRGRRVSAGRLHISLHFVGDDRRRWARSVYAARLAGKAVAMEPFEAAFRRITTFDGKPSHRVGTRPAGSRPRPLVLLAEGEGLLHLHRRLGAAMERNGLTAARRFAPHMTLSYGPDAVAVRTIEPIPFVVREFVLVHSVPGRPRYDIVDRWPLEG